MLSKIVSKKNKYLQFKMTFFVLLLPGCNIDCSDHRADDN